MDQRLLHHYNNELQYMQEMGSEFARHFPKIAGRLGMEGLECADPYVERLLEGFAFMAARIQLKLEEEFPRFCQHLLEVVYPDYLSPLPSMAVVQVQPDTGDSSLAEGFTLPKGSALMSRLGTNMQTRCEYRTAHALTLFPIEVAEAEYLPTRASLASLGIKPGRSVAAGIRLKINTIGEVDISSLKLDELPLFIGGRGTIPLALYEQLLGAACGLSVVTGNRDDRQVFGLETKNVQPYGFEPGQALLNYRNRSFEGYRLLREYFAFPERFRFVNFTGLRSCLSRASGQSFHIVVHLERRANDLENVVDKSHFSPFCTPAVNLFRKRADRIGLNDKDHELHVVADKSRPMDYEVHQVLEVTGYGGSSDDRQKFLPFYGLKDEHITKEDAAFYTVHRKHRMLSSKQLARGARSGYPGQEMFISLVDANEAPFRSSLVQIGVDTLCSNRDLPMQMPLGQKEGDFTLEVSAPVERIQTVAGPTRPDMRQTVGDYVWRIISHLSLNYLSLIDEDPDEGAAALREMLQLYSSGNTVADRQINGLLTVNAKPVTRRLPIPGPISFGRGLEVTLRLDRSGFEAGGMFLFGTVINEFFSQYVSINHMTETVVLRDDDLEVGRWPVKTGLRQPL